MKRLFIGETWGRFAFSITVVGVQPEKTCDEQGFGRRNLTSAT